MGAGVLLALTIPVLSAAGADVFSAALVPGRAVDLEQRRASELLREDETDGAPPRGRVDLDTGVAHLALPPADVPPR